MRQGIIIFVDAPPAGAPAESALRATVMACLQADGTTPFLAYGQPEASAPLRALVGGPPPRFFPQATRPTLGERMAQAFAFLFVQDYERVVLLTPGFDGVSPERLTGALAALDGQPVAIDAGAAGYMVALRRADFPLVAAIFEEIEWEQSGAKAAAERVITESGAKA